MWTSNYVMILIGQCSQEWTKQNFWKKTFKNVYFYKGDPEKCLTFKSRTFPHKLSSTIRLLSNLLSYDSFRSFSVIFGLIFTRQTISIFEGCLPQILLGPFLNTLTNLWDCFWIHHLIVPQSIYIHYLFPFLFILGCFFQQYLFLKHGLNSNFCHYWL